MQKIVLAMVFFANCGRHHDSSVNLFRNYGVGEAGMNLNSNRTLTQATKILWHAHELFEKTNPQLRAKKF